MNKIKESINYFDFKFKIEDCMLNTPFYFKEKCYTIGNLESIVQIQERDKQKICYYDYLNENYNSKQFFITKEEVDGKHIREYLNHGLFQSIEHRRRCVDVDFYWNGDYLE